MSGSAPQGQANSDQEMIRLIICLIILAFILIFVAQMQEERANAIIGAMSYVHLFPFAELVRFFPSLMDIPWIGRSFFIPIVQAHDFLSDGGFSEMNSAQRNLLLNYSGRAALLIYAPALFWIGFRGHELRPDQKYRQKYTLESMINIQTEEWITARAARHTGGGKAQDLSPRLLATLVSDKIAKAQSSLMPGLALPRKSISLAPSAWNRSLRPEEWLIAKGLAFNMDQYTHASRPEVISSDEDFAFRADWEKLQIESISEVFAQQLRTPYGGIKSMRPCHLAIFSVMALYYNFETKAGDILLNEIALVADSARCKKGQIDKLLLSQNDIMGKIRSIAFGKQGKALSLHAEKHAWLETAFPTFLSLARFERGVLPSAAFLWLKTEDRLLWYILNNVGNEAIMVEAAGAMAHWRAECQIGAKIRRPAVFQASRALLEDYLDQTPARIEKRHKRAERGRIPAEQSRLIMQRRAGMITRTEDPDGIKED